MFEIPSQIFLAGLMLAGAAAAGLNQIAEKFRYETGITPTLAYKGREEE